MDSSSIWEAIHSPAFQAGFFAGEGLASEFQQNNSFVDEYGLIRTWAAGDTSDVIFNQQLTSSPTRSEDCRSHWSFDDSDIIGITEVQPFMNYPPGKWRDMCNESRSCTSPSDMAFPVSIVPSSPPIEIHGPKTNPALSTSPTSSKPQHTCSHNQVSFNYTETNYNYVEGNGGRPQIHVDGYKFYKGSIRKRATIWTCAGKIKYKCKKRLRQMATSVLISDGDHTHPGDHMLTKVELFVESIRKRVRTELNSSIKDIYDSQAKLYQKNGPETKAILEAAPTSEFIMSAMKRARRKVLPVIPKSREDVNFGLSGLAQHILIEDGNTEKIVVVGTPDLFKHLCMSEQLHMDGTFKSAPTLYAQLFIIHGIAHDMLWPLLFCLLPGKTQGLYTRLFRLLVEHAINQGLQLSPRCIHIDFEKAISNSLQTVFPGSTVKGCFFHFSQCVFKRIKKVGLGTEYSMFSLACREILRRLFYIPFLPVEEMVAAFEQVADESKWSEVEGTLLPEHIIKLRKVMVYYRNNWICRMRLERYNVWSVTVRTNNKAEAFNNNLNKKVTPHPNVYALVRFLGEDQNVNTEIGIMQAAKGSKVCKQRRIYRVRDEMIEEAKEWLRHKVYTPVEYVDRISLLYDEKKRERMMRTSHEEQARQRQEVLQVPLATPMPAAVRRKSHLRQYCRLSVPRQRMVDHTSLQPKQQPKSEGQQVCTPRVRKKAKVSQQRSTTYKQDTPSQRSDQMAVCKEHRIFKNSTTSQEPTLEPRVKMKKQLTKENPNPRDTCKRPAGEPTVGDPPKKKSKILNPSASRYQLTAKAKRFAQGTWSKTITKRKRVPFLTPYAMPDTLVPATPLWLQNKRKFAERNSSALPPRLQTSEETRQGPMGKAANLQRNSPLQASRAQKKLSLEEAIRMVLSDDE